MDPKKTDRVNRLKEAEAYELKQLGNYLKDYLGVKDKSLDEW